MMIEDHIHDPETGRVLPAPEVAAVEETGAETHAAVEIAKIEAERDVQVARLETKAVDTDLLAEVAALRAELEALRASRMPQDEPEEPDVVLAVPEPEPAPEPVLAPEMAESEELPPADHTEHEQRPRKRTLGLGMW